MPNRDDINVFIASSGELAEERERIVAYLARINKDFKHLHLTARMWEYDLNAGSVTDDSKRIQDEINKRLDKCQISIVLLHSKLGIYTKEEYKRSRDQNKKVYVFFKKGVTPDSIKEIEQYKEVVAFRNLIEKQGDLQHLSFNDWTELENKLNNNLPEYLRKKFKPLDTQIQSSINTVYSKTTKDPDCLNDVPSYALGGFVGRKEKLKEIHDSLVIENKPTLLLNGMGGVGKTTLAKAYVAMFGQYYNHILWTKAQDGLEKGIQSDTLLTEKLKITEIKQNIVSYCVDALRSYQGPNLWVIDNAIEDFNRDLLERLPTNQNWKVLLTSRLKINGPKQIDIEVLNEQDALLLFKKHYNITTKEEKNIIKINAIVGRHTLTVELLGKLANKVQYAGRLEKLQEDLAKQGLNVAHKIALEAESSSIKEKNASLVNVLQQLFSLDGLTEEELQLLKYWSLLPNTDLPIEEVEEIIPVKNDDLYALINTLGRKGWISQDGSSCKCHKIIQETVLKKHPLQSWQKELEDYLCHFKKVIEINQYQDNPVLKFKWATYARSAFLILKNHSSSAFITFLNEYGYILQHMGQYKESVEMRKLAFSIGERLYDLNDPKIAELQNDLAIALYDIKDYQEAKDLLVKALNIDLLNSPRNSQLVTIRQHNLATVLRKLGDFNKAKDLLEIVLENDIIKNGQNHPSVAITKSSLALVLYDLGKNHEAKRLFKSALEINISHYGESHPRVAYNYHFLGIIFRKIDNKKDALNYFQKSYLLRLKLFGPDHPDTKEVLADLERLKSEMG